MATGNFLGLYLDPHAGLVVLGQQDNCIVCSLPSGDSRRQHIMPEIPSNSVLQIRVAIPSHDHLFLLHEHGAGHGYTKRLHDMHGQ